MAKKTLNNKVYFSTTVHFAQEDTEEMEMFRWLKRQVYLTDLNMSQVIRKLIKEQLKNDADIVSA